MLRTFNQFKLSNFYQYANSLIKQYLTLNIINAQYQKHQENNMSKTLYHEPQVNSDDELNQQINDKLSQLWAGMKNKKKQMIRNLTPSYSRRSEQTLSQLNATHNQTIYTTNHNNTATEQQLMKIKEKLVSEESNRKTKETEIDRLKSTISQLTNDKKILIKEIEKINHRNISQIEYQNYNQSENSHFIQEQNHTVDGKTANFYSNNPKAKKYSQIFNKKPRAQFTESSINKQNQPNRQNTATKINSSSKTKHSTSLIHDKINAETLEDLPKSRLIELLKSTSEYREFAFYYDSHQLSYLKRLQTQHKKNCQTNYSQQQKKYWAPTQIYDRMRHLNFKNKWGLNQTQLQEMLSEAKTYFQINQELKINQIKNQYNKRMQKLKRQKNNSIPYDLVRLSNAKEREICKKRTKSIKN